MKSLIALLLGIVPVAAAAAPVPNVPPAPSIEGKYTVLTSGTNRPTKGGGGFAADPLAGGFSGPASTLRRETIITKDSITIDGRTATWEYKLDPTTKPMSIDLTITPLRGKKTKHLGIVEQTGDKLSLAYAPEGAERPKDFEDTENTAQFIFQKAPPPPRAEYRIVVLTVGQEAEAEKTINALSKEGYEVAFTTNPAAVAGQNPVIHLVLKRMVKP